MLKPIQAQEIFGNWEMTNDEGRVNSIIKIFQKEDGEVCGKVTRITREKHRDRRCTNCKGEKKNKPIEGLELIYGLEKDGDEYVDGELINPKSGKVYKCKIWLDEDDPNKLKVRGYVAFFYKTMTWNRQQ